MRGHASARRRVDQLPCPLRAAIGLAACMASLPAWLAACVEPRADDHVGMAKLIRGAPALDSAYDGVSAIPGAGALPGATSPGTAGETIAGTGGVIGNAMGGRGGAGAAASGSGGAGAGGVIGNAMGGRGGAGGGGGAQAGAGGAAGATSGEGSPTAGSAGTLQIRFTTVDQNGRYAPANVGAIWIEDGSGKFIKTLKRWAGIRASHLTAWKAASGGWPSFFGGGNATDQMDAISAGTMRSHGMHDVSWDMKDLMGQLVPDGMYKVGIEVTEDNRVAGANARIDFVKGPMAQPVMPPDKAPFAGLTISYRP
jgi:hypothetical protein